VVNYKKRPARWPGHGFEHKHLFFLGYYRHNGCDIAFPARGDREKKARGFVPVAIKTSYFAVG